VSTEADDALCELAEGALSGDGAEAWACFDRAWPALLRQLAIFQRALGVRPNIRDDCGQAVLLRVWRGRTDYRGHSLPELKGWLHTICRREHARLLEGSSRQPRLESELARDEADTDLNSSLEAREQPDQHSTDALVAARDELSALEACITRLDDNLREVTELLYSAEAPSEREVAELLGCSKSQVNVLRQKALRALAACLKQSEGQA